MKKKFMKALIVGCMLLGLTACGGDVEISNVSLQDKLSEEQIYYASDLKLEVASDVEDVDFRVYGSGIYYPEGQAVETYSTTDRKTTVDTYIWADAPGQWAFEKICYSGSGELYGLVEAFGTSVATGSAGEAGTDNIFLCKFDTERNLIFSKELAEYYQGTAKQTLAQSKLEVGTDGRVYIRSGDEIWIFEGDGSYKGDVSFGSVKAVQVLDFVGDAYKDLYVLYEDKESQEQYVAEIDTETGAVTKVQRTIGLTGLDATENGLVAFNGAVVYRYDREVCALTELFHWSECNVNGAGVYGVCLMMDGNIFVAGNVQGSVKNYLVKSLMIEKVEGSQNGKTDIRIALCDSKNSQFLNYAAGKFNRNSEQYNIILENYAADGRAAAWARLSAELAAGVGPDMIDLSVGNAETMVESGYLEDLELYLEENESLSTGDFMATALESYRVNGVLTAIPQHFSIEVLIGNSDYVGTERGWTLEEMLDFMEKYEGQRVFADDIRQDQFFYYMLYMNESTFVDRAAGTCDFDNETFRRLVDLAEGYPLEIEKPADGEVRPSEYTNLKDVNGFLCYVPLIEFRGLQVYGEVLEGNMTCIGFPDEEKGGVIAGYGDALAINSNSQCKEGAWAFLEYYLPLLGASTMGYFPTYRPSLEYFAGKEMKLYATGTVAYGSDKYYFMEHPATQEEIDTVYDLLEAARPAQMERALINILVEELEGYYEGEITMDAAIANIEKEVLVYLAE